MSRDELVFLDADGAVRPVGEIACRRLRAKKGAFRIVPSPSHVVFMRYVGEDGARDEEDGAIVRLAGEITAPGTLCDIMALVAQAGWKGELLVADGEKSRSLFFESGNIVGAQTNAPGERIGDIMLRVGVLTDEQMAAVEKALSPARRFGETAIELGFLRSERLFELIEKQTEEIVFATLMVGDGMFYFLDRYDFARVASRYHVSATSLLLEGVRRMDESKYFRERIPSGDHIPVPIAGRGDPPEELFRIFAACDGVRSVDEIGRVYGLGEFDVTKAVFQLVQGGFVRINAPTPIGLVALLSIFNDAMGVIFGQIGRAHV
jgi:hypothetical protein